MVQIWGFDMFWLRLASLWPGPALPCRRNRWDDQRPQLVLIHHIHLLAPCTLSSQTSSCPVNFQIKSFQWARVELFQGSLGQLVFQILWQSEFAVANDTNNISHWVTPKPPLSPTDGNDFCYGYGCAEFTTTPCYNTHSKPFQVESFNLPHNQHCTVEVPGES